MKTIDDFRIYYNTTIHPELMRLERSRIRLIRLMFFSALVLIGIIILEIYLRLIVVTLFLSLPIILLMTYLGSRVQRFRRTFKPNVINLILDFIDDSPNRGRLIFSPSESIDKEIFLAGELFRTSAPFYKGEDHISGSVGEMPFELSELDVREVSKVSNKLNVIFKGVYFKATYPEETEGRLIIWPRHRSPYFTKSIKAFTWDGGINVDDEMLHERFSKHFISFASEDTHVAGILSEPMQRAIVDYMFQTEREMFFSFNNQEIHIAISDDRDLLEPFILRSNLSFELVRSFFEDINLLLKLIEEFDQNH